MLKKAGLLTVGVTAGLLAVAPIASAGVSDDHDHDDKKHSKHDDDDHGKKKKHHKSDDDGDHHHNRGDGDFSNSCSSEAGDIENDATGTGSLLGIGQVAGPVASGSNLDILNCTNILNDFLNENDVAISVLGNAGAGD